MQKQFHKNVERLIDPISVGAIHFVQGFNRLLPKSIQKKIVEASGKKTPSMGFVVEPYATFLCYEITDTAKAQALLPDSFKLIKTRIFTDDKPKHYAIFGCFRAHTSAFWGLRNEFYIIAEDQKSKMLSWIIVDYDSDTISYDKNSGLRSPNATDAVVTTACSGEVIVDIKNKELGRELVFDLKIPEAKRSDLNQRLWLEGNLSIGYGKVLSQGSADIFSLKFEPCEVRSALKIPKENLNLESNTWYPNMLESKPSQIACFPFAQHFVSDSPGYASNLKNLDELKEAVSKIDFTKIKKFSADSFRKQILLSGAISTLIILALLAIIIFT